MATIPLFEKLPPRRIINPIGNDHHHHDNLEQVTGIDFEGLLRDFATAIPFFDEFVLLDVHFVGESSSGHVSPMILSATCLREKRQCEDFFGLRKGGQKRSLIRERRGSGATKQDSLNAGTVTKGMIADPDEEKGKGWSESPPPPFLLSAHPRKTCMWPSLLETTRGTKWIKKFSTGTSPFK
ncbi:hypothetical protein ACHAXS_013824 [Conticribra weissflogii]